MTKLDEIYDLAAKVNGRVNRIYLHWSAGHYNGVSDHYHINIKGDGEVVITGDFDEVKPHTYARNTGAVGVSLCCCFDATTKHLGTEPPTTEQIEKMAEVIAALSRGLNIPIDKYHVMTHGEAANNEDGGTSHLCYAWWNDEYGDGNTRGDLEFLGIPQSPKYNPYATDGTRGGDVLRGKAIYYLNKMNGVQSENNVENKGIIETPLLNNDLPEVKIWNFFKSKGLNDFAVAGIMGNLYAESGLISTNLQNSFENKLGSDEEYTRKVNSGEYSKETFTNDSAGYGLAQWTYFARKAALYDYAKMKGKSIGDLDTQLEFLWNELLDGYVSLMNILMDASSVRQASDAFLLDFERPADQSEGQKAKRAGFSQEFYDKYAGKVEGATTGQLEGASNMSEKRYNTIDEVPDWAKSTIQKLIDHKSITDENNLDLSRDMIRLLVIFEREMRR